MYMHFALCRFVFGNYRSSYIMVKMIRGWKTMEQWYCSKENKGTFLHTSKLMLGKYELMNISR